MPAEDAMNRRELLAGGVNLMATAALSSRAGAANPSDAPLMRKIPSSGEELALIGLGTSRTFEVGESAAERAPLREVLQGFFASGARLIDTSPMYSTAERVLGELMMPDMHQRAFLATKVWTRGAHAELARVLAREKLAFVQFNYSPLTRDAEKRLLPLAAQRGVAVLVNRPFEDGALFQAVRGKPLPAWAGDLDAASWGQLALKYI